MFADLVEHAGDDDGVPSVSLFSGVAKRPESLSPAKTTMSAFGPRKAVGWGYCCGWLPLPLSMRITPG
ncbi:hypothetical protein D3C59_35075 [Streptomyces sp. SHP22-7]|nr:hypothetical protein D3C59_35075 [Streptomyces sp. SHP22-7]